MAYVPVPIDLKKVKTKAALNMTKRQLIFYGIAGCLAFCIYKLLYGKLPIDALMTLMIIVAVPCFLLAEKEVDGLAMETYLLYKIRFHFQKKERIYMTENSYSIERKKNLYRKEIKTIERKAKSNRVNKKNGRRKN